MSGNVWEWCWDAIDSDRLFRGGGWDNSALGCSVSVRYAGNPGDRGKDSGFRLARSSGN